MMLRGSGSGYHPIIEMTPSKTNCKMRPSRGSFITFSPVSSFRGSLSHSHPFLLLRIPEKYQRERERENKHIHPPYFVLYSLFVRHRQNANIAKIQACIYIRACIPYAYMHVMWCDVMRCAHLFLFFFFFSRTVRTQQVSGCSSWACVRPCCSCAWFVGQAPSATTASGSSGWAGSVSISWRRRPLAGAIILAVVCHACGIFLLYSSVIYILYQAYGPSC